MSFRLHTNMIDSFGQFKIFEFGKRCNYVDYENDKFCIFKNTNLKAGIEETLMIIPYEKILYIERVEDK